MPYIDMVTRNYIDAGGSPHTVGELNYLLTSMVLDFLGDDPNYEKFNSVIGALECCKLEMYRRAVAPYEDVKIKENGDVY